VLMRYGWADGHIALIGPVQALPAAQAFQPLSAGEFASFNFMNGRLTRVRFQVDAAGKITGLTLASKTGDIVASRASAKRVCRPKTGATKAQTKRAKTN